MTDKVVGVQVPLFALKKIGFGRFFCFPGTPSSLRLRLSLRLGLHSAKAVGSCVALYRVDWRTLVFLKVSRFGRLLSFCSLLALTPACSVHKLTGEVMSEYTNQHLRPYLLSRQDLDMACELGVSMGSFILLWLPSVSLSVLLFLRFSFLPKLPSYAIFAPSLSVTSILLIFGPS